MKYVIILFCLFCGLSGYASEPDSMKVERWLREASSLPKDSCRTLHFAKKMLGTPYVAGTLDVNNEETLVVHLDKVDCTTLVETVLALAIADQQGKQNFEAFKEALMLVRYRDGHLAGYSSRLHYFSDWIKNNEAKGLVRECTSDTKISLSSKLSLNFMSTHSDSYLPMKKDTSLISQVALFEKAWQGVEVRFIPKEKLNQSSNELKIKNGDILAITTNIKGLDVVHVGFAYWNQGKLHLLHASSVAEKVIMDNQSLYDYSKNKKAHTGVRAISFIYCR
ncbi:MAG: DUF1460 domain-containing protein [Bacteroidaceae bacterium]|nr:DUF1460 domain-containing protein [Bacteroidaceae bacterium]